MPFVSLFPNYHHQNDLGENIAVRESNLKQEGLGAGCKRGSTGRRILNTKEISKESFKNKDIITHPLRLGSPTNIRNSK